MLTIEQVEQELQMSEHEIRYYTNLGFIPNVKRNDQNERVFDEQSLDWLRVCDMLRNSGMSIKQIKQYVDLCKVGIDSMDERLSIIKGEQTRAVQRLKAAEKNLKLLNEKIEDYEQAIAEHKNVDPLSSQDIN
ncbi:MerR family transcriptional regulator [Lactobacillus sp. Sy-1]|uniref:MerR family transcriptional regulator n=1 Tax=Lactobacillus sp. Sy-1 TaxID=2109645 RepID=UPI001C5B51DE|nr:MerR family transcriptional regulator [Lactobacillus sp. Sy-1]MBW1606064.1 MerR family transcriptional regulator [Lactobacillus sp. Sy-1]